jgi:hypothetical protein
MANCGDWFTGIEKGFHESHGLFICPKKSGFMTRRADQGVELTGIGLREFLIDRYRLSLTRIIATNTLWASWCSDKEGARCSK